VNYVNLLTITVITVTLAHYSFENRFREALFYGVSFTVIAVASEGIAIILGMIRHNEGLEHILYNEGLEHILYNDQFHILFLNVISKAILFGVCLVIRGLYKNIKNRANEGETSFLLVFLIFILISIYCITTIGFHIATDPEDMWRLCIISISLLSSSLVVFRSYDFSLAKNEMKVRYENERLNSLAGSSLYEESRQNEAILRKQQHETQNLLISIYDLLNTNPSMAKQLVEESLDEYNKTLSGLAITVDVNNPLVPHIINRICRICAQEDIKFSMKLEYNDLSFLSPIDTSTLLNNALNNGVEGSLTTDEIEMRYVELLIKRVHNELLISVINSKSKANMINIKGDTSGVVSSKKGSGHGFGLKNMQDIADRYGGKVTFKDDSHVFYLMITLKLTKRVQK